MIELACNDIIFHFNKKHLEDPTIPMWIIKTKGKTYYIQHLDCEMGWSTKETPDNDHTKGSIKIRNAYLQIDDDNCARISPLDEHIKVRLKNQEKGITRTIIYGQFAQQMRDALKQMSIKHGPIKAIGGACSSTFYVTDIYDKADFTALLLALAGTPFRELMPNEGYYRMYDDHKYKDKDFIDEDEYFYDNQEEDDSDDQPAARPTIPERIKAIWSKALAFPKIGRQLSS